MNNVDRFIEYCREHQYNDPSINSSTEKQLHEKLLRILIANPAHLHLDSPIYCSGPVYISSRSGPLQARFGGLRTDHSLFITPDIAAVTAERVPVVAEASLSRSEQKLVKKSNRLVTQCGLLLWLFEFPEIMGVTYYLRDKEHRKATVRHSLIAPGSDKSPRMILEREVDLPEEFTF